MKLIYESQHVYNMSDCITKTYRTEGIMVFYRGFSGNYLRLGPHFIIALPLFEYVRSLFGMKGL